MTRVELLKEALITTATNWRRVPKEFQIDTKKLETNPPLAMS